MRLPWMAGMAAICIGSAAGGAGAQTLAEYVERQSVHLPDSLVEAYDGERFLIIVRRDFDGERERELIQRAEGLFPSPERIGRAVEAYLTERSGQGWVRAFQEAEGIPWDRWWWRSWDDTLLPFAITGAAIQHYMDRVRTLSAGPNPFAAHEPGIDHTASVRYTAEANPLPDSGGMEVRLEVEWSFYCGRLCGLWFTHSRRVVFNEDDEVVLVEGDRAPRFGVS